MEQKNLVKKIVNILGKIVLVLSLGFIVQKLFSYYNDINITIAILTPTFVISFIIMTACNAVSITGNSLLYFSLLHNLDQNARFYSVLTIYGKSNLYKYLPGNVIHLVGKNQIAFESGCRHEKIIESTIIELVCVSVSASLTGLLFSYKNVMHFINSRGYSLFFYIVAGAGIIVSTAFFVFKRNCFRACLHMVIFESVCNVVFGYAFAINLLDAAAITPVLLTAIGFYSFSWLIGFIIPGAPGGIGVREAVLLWLMESYVTIDRIVVSTLLCRIACIMGDILSYFIIRFIAKRLSDET